MTETWEKKFAWLPHQCEVSGECIWFKDGYKGTRVWKGPGEPVIEHSWMTENQFIIMMLKGNKWDK